MKGQIFLIISVLVLLALILLKIQTASTPEQLRFYGSLDLKDIYENLQGEYEKAVEISLLQGKNSSGIGQNLNNFSNYVIDSLEQKNYSLKILYSLAFANTTLNVSVGNFLGESITDISINISDGQNDFISSLPNRQSSSKGFALPNAFNVSVTYYLGGQKKNFTYSGGGTVSAYLDLYLKQADSYFNNRLVFNKTLGR